MIKYRTWYLVVCLVTVDALSHWRERKGPWGRWSSFDTGDSLRELRAVIPEILTNLGFAAAQQ